MTLRHRITEPDSEARTGICSQCGPVEVLVGPQYKGRNYWRCAQSRRRDENSRYRTDPDVRDAQRQARFLRKYGITVVEYDQMLEEQQGVCARCGEEPGALKLAVDHCHETGRIRGLLCGSCNTYLGRLEANLHLLEQDMQYLRKRM